MEFTYVAFNMEDAALGGAKNRYLRKAMALAYDEAPVIERFYLGLANPAQSPVVPGVSGFDPRYRNPSRQYNLTKARELLAKAGHPGGKGIPELVYDTTSGTARRQLAEYFQRSMAELGIKISLNLLAWPELISRVRKKQAQIWDISWIYDYPDAENAWQLLVAKNESPGPNASNFKNRELDRLYQRVTTTTNPRERAKLFSRMNAILAEEVPWILGVYKLDTRLIHPWVSNFKIHAFDYNVEKYLRVDAARRAQTLR
jgi:ABC-type transport system substrate-binding protein